MYMWVLQCTEGGVLRELPYRALQVTCQWIGNDLVCSCGLLKRLHTLFIVVTRFRDGNTHHNNSTMLLDYVK